jgi:hypothetical protein
MSDAPAEAAQPPAPPRPKTHPSRIIVFLLLAIAVVALGFDLNARTKQGRAFTALEAFVDEDRIEASDDAAIAEPPTPSIVQEMVGKAPDLESRMKDDFQQTFSWQGVFNRYHVHAHYGGVTLAAEDSKEGEPLLLRVEKSSNYIWE